MSSSYDLLLVQVIHRERLEEAERRRTIHRLQQQHKQQRKQQTQSHDRRRTTVTRWLRDRLTA